MASFVRRGVFRQAGKPRGARRIVSAPVADPDFSSVVLLLDFAGVDGATDITDLSNSAHVDTFVSDAEVDTGNQVIGENSLLLPSTDDAVTFPTSSDFDFGTGDFTVECHFYSTAFEADQAQISIYGPPTGWWMRTNGDEAAPEKIEFGDEDTTILSEDITIVDATWYHLAVSRSGTTMRAFLDGVQAGSGTTDSTDLEPGASSTPLVIGGLTTTLQGVVGAVAAIRITKGVARYTTNFTPPTVFYPTS